MSSHITPPGVSPSQKKCLHWAASRESTQRKWGLDSEQTGLTTSGLRMLINCCSLRENFLFESVNLKTSHQLIIIAITLSGHYRNIFQCDTHLFIYFRKLSSSYLKQYKQLNGTLVRRKYLDANTTVWIFMAWVTREFALKSIGFSY